MRALKNAACSQAERESTYLVVGVTCSEEAGMKHGFGRAFRAATDHARARVRKDSFESSVMEVHADDVSACWAREGRRDKWDLLDLLNHTLLRPRFCSLL